MQEITWRATKLRTKAGEFLIVPNSMISKEPILNYSEPIGSDTRRRRGRRQLPDAAERGEGGDSSKRLPTRRWPCARPSPSAGAELRGVGDQLHDLVLDGRLRHRTRGARSGAHQHLVRVPPPQHRDSVADPVQYERERRAGWTSGTSTPPPILAAIDLFAPLAAGGAAWRWRATARRPSVCRRRSDRPAGCAGNSMFVVLSGRVRVVLEPSGQEVGGDPGWRLLRRDVDVDRRSAHRHGQAATTCTVLEIRPAQFRGSRWRTRRCSITCRQLSGRAAPASTRHARRLPPLPRRKRSRHLLARMRQFFTLKSEI